MRADEYRLPPQKLLLKDGEVEVKAVVVSRSL